MKPLEQVYEHDTLRIAVRQGPGKSVTVAWGGVSDSRDPAAFLNRLASDLSKNIASESVVLDFSALEFMNSATVAPLIAFVRLFATPGRSVLLVFSDSDWQRPHAQCMRAIARTLVDVRVEVSHQS